MKIIHVSASYKPAYIYGGPTMSISELLEELEKKLSNSTYKKEVELLTTTANGDMELPVSTGVTLKIDGVSVTFFNRLTKDHSHFSPGLIKELWRKLNNQDKSPHRSYNKPPIIVHIHAWWNLVSVLACVIALVNNAKVIISPRGTLSKYSFNNRTRLSKKTFHYIIGKPLLRQCHFHVTSEKEKLDVLNLLNPKSITIIPNLVAGPNRSLFGSTFPNEAKADRPNKASSKVLKLLFLSRIEEKKGLDLLIKALINVQFPYTLTIAGPGKKEYVDELKQLINEMRLNEKSIIWLGQQDQYEKFNLLSSHDLLLLTSYDENFANVVIESLYMGTPVLISDKVGLSDYVKRKQLGWICKTTPKSINESLNFIYNQDFHRLKEISKKCQEIVKTDFSTNELIQQYNQLYNSVS